MVESTLQLLSFFLFLVVFRYFAETRIINPTEEKIANEIFAVPWGSIPSKWVCQWQSGSPKSQITQIPSSIQTSAYAVSFRSVADFFSLAANPK